jgi:HlyD family secretion protein
MSSAQTTTAPGSAHQDAELARIVGQGSGSSRRRRSLRLIVPAALVALAAAVFLATRFGKSAGTPQYRTAGVTRGDLVVTVSATGNLQPTNEVDVGSEVSGLVESVFVDDNDRVTKGQVLARLDVSRLNEQVIDARAVLASAEARVQQAGATVQEARAKLTRLRRVSELSDETVVSKADLEAAEATLTRAMADDSSSKAAVEQARASLNAAEINLSKASIRSPINGIVLARKIEPGQTVAASFTTPVLFTLAEDLSKMELQVDVDEADVSEVRDGQSATFTVDAYGNRKFPAAIKRVGFGSQTKDGVVSYKTILTVNNDDLSLRPGMTATAEITTVERKGALLVPNAALRFTPAVPAVVPAEKTSIVSGILPHPPAQDRKQTNGNGKAKDGSQQVWVLQNGRPTAVSVVAGASDGRVTEITGGELREGTAVITESVGGES